MTVYAEVQKPTISSQPDQARSPAGRIQAELHLLGYEIAESTVAKYRVRSHKPPSQTWKSFLRNHAGQIAAIDFFTVPTVTFNVLYCFVLLHNRRQVVHLNVTAHPTALWTAQQIIEAFPEETAPRFLLRVAIRSMEASSACGWREWVLKKS
jgi:hypothetical protein